MNDKTLPFSRELLERITAEYPTPLHIYDETGIRRTARRLNEAFAWCEGFKEFFAVKATPNPFILKLLADEGFGADCSSLAELVLADRVGIRGEDVMFSSNNTPAEEFVKAREIGAIVNLDDVSHLPFLIEHAGMPEMISFRFNPGPEREGNRIIGDPKEAKFGVTRAQFFDAYAAAREAGATRFGLHTMVISNALELEAFSTTARMLFELARDLKDRLDLRVEFVNLGGGFGVPYRPEESPVDLEAVGRSVRDLYEEIIVPAGLDPLRVYTESGRLITGPHGFLVSRVRHKKGTYKNFVGLDASMANLMRPGMYGAYHHLTVVGKETAPADHVYDVTGSLCENNDKFAIDRALPEIDIGDLVVIHDTGAHGHAMGFNYNGKLRSAELLVRENGAVEEIRRAETLDDLFATLDFSGI